jgi:hypothetical protein
MAQNQGVLRAKHTRDTPIGIDETSIGAPRQVHRAGKRCYRAIPDRLLRRHFLTSGHSLASSGLAASSGEIVAISL